MHVRLMIIYVDVDGTICDEVKFGDGTRNYHRAKPMTDRITYLNELFNQGHEIHYWTARGAQSGKEWHAMTEQQLQNWGCLYTSFSTKKPHYDLWIDDKAENANAYGRVC